MNRRTFFCAALASATHVAAQSRPNFVIVLVDDWGASDLGCYGSRFYRTPHMDRLAAQGMKFTQAYSACTVCSPSRAALLTGKYPARLHLTDWIAGHDYPWAKLKPPDWTKYLPAAEQTFAEGLKPLGYATASIGKWHLTTTENDPSLLPDKQGFDINHAGTGRGQPPSYFSPYGISTLKEGATGEYLTDREADEACRFIKTNKDRPFLVYLPHHTVHTPLQAKPEKVEKYKAVVDPSAPQRNPVYAAMIESLDESIGRVMETLESAGLAQNTVLFLTGDNGGHLPSTNTNLGLRAGKGSVYEGGVRVPLLIRWPGKIPPGSICDEPVIGCDVAATVLDLAGLKPQNMDGISIRPVFQKQRLQRDAIYWHYPHYHPGGARPYSAVRSGRYKLIVFHEDDSKELYDLEADPEEKHNVFSRLPKVAEQLNGKLKKWWKATNAQMPLKNPDYEPGKAALTRAQARAKGLV